MIAWQPLVAVSRKCSGQFGAVCKVVMQLGRNFVHSDVAFCLARASFAQARDNLRHQGRCRIPVLRGDVPMNLQQACRIQRVEVGVDGVGQAAQGSQLLRQA
ncbi:hypothetical protein D3C75_958680 [compost metagenome]